MNAAASPQQIENVSTFPPPPPFYKLYLNYDSDIDSTATTSATTDPSTSSTLSEQQSIPNIILPLQPPIPPKQGSNYNQFGQTYSTVDVLPTLDELDMVQLYPKGDIEPISELKKLNRSILFNYLQLLETLIENPSDFKTKVDDISLLFINFHHLLNSYRPHQARETLLSIMTEQIKNRTQSNQLLKKSLETCKESLIQTFNNLNNETEEKEKLSPTLATTTKEQPSTPQTINKNEELVKPTNWLDQLVNELSKIEKPQ
ncbi:hypothetical protein CYY_005223 [Polysphondylium violaceum]|uniref:Mediator of RNA polymerase II transcription subunit 7 n=1 Tax=Polysphondylium violaceum TaxID=133409 RepID=A0A8J4PUM6_9MYCE|nr:hypothetical protein CYY_005223 [Polysphondylium violaceum]